MYICCAFWHTLVNMTCVQYAMISDFLFSDDSGTTARSPALSMSAIEPFLDINKQIKPTVMLKDIIQINMVLPFAQSSEGAK